MSVDASTDKYDQDMGTEGKLTLEEIGLAVVRIEGKLDLLTSRQDDASRQAADHEGRIRSLEQKAVVTTRMFWSGLVGVATFIGAAAELAYVLKK